VLRLPACGCPDHIGLNAKQLAPCIDRTYGILGMGVGKQICQGHILFRHQSDFPEARFSFLTTNHHPDGIEVKHNIRQTALKSLGSSAGSPPTSKTYDMIMIVA
jgi:hypothetical protein